jgi:hypothetical protein
MADTKTKTSEKTSARATAKAPVKKKTVGVKAAKTTATAAKKPAAKASAGKPKAGAKAAAPKTSAKASAGTSARRATAKKTTGANGSAKQRPQTDPASLHEEISLLAYYLWEQRGRPLDSSDEDWKQAEERVLKSIKS